MVNSIMYKEILSQPDTLRQCYQYNKQIVSQLAQLVKQRNISNIMLTARGSSNNACLYFKYLCEIYTGIPVNMINPSVFTMYNGKLDLSSSLVIAVSQSGKAEDVRQVVMFANKQKAITLAITNDLNSPLANECQFSMFLNTDKEVSVAATKTFTAQMLCLAMLNYCLSGGNINDFEDKLEDIIQSVNMVIKLSHKNNIEKATNKIENCNSFETLVDTYINQQQCIILTRGLCLSIGKELSLKLQETCYINAVCYATSDFYHGPYALINSNSTIIFIAFDDMLYNDNILMLSKLKADNVNVTLFTNNNELCKYATNSFVLPKTDIASVPFVAAVCCQLFACLLSGKKGIDADNPRGLKKITITK